MAPPVFYDSAELAQELGAEPVAEEARELATRVSEGRFYVACIGQFKRGKSTLLNALVGHEVVPTGFVPVTAVPTVIANWYETCLCLACLFVSASALAFVFCHAYGREFFGLDYSFYVS